MPVIGGKKGNPPPEPGENKKYQKSGGEMQAERDWREKDRKDNEDFERFVVEHDVKEKEDGDSES